MSGETELEIPEIVILLVHPLKDAGLSADIDWTAGARGLVTLSFCGVKAFAEEDCKTEPSHMLQNMFPYQAGDGPIETRSFYRFAARRIRMPHETAAAPERAPHSLMLKFNIRGCLPESEKLLPVEKRMLMSNQLQPVVTATLRYPQLYETATAAERNQPLVVATHQRVGGTVHLHETCDLVYHLQTQSPENADSMMTLEIGSALCVEQQDWAQWVAGADMQGSLIAIALMPILIGACLDIGHDLVLAQRAAGLDVGHDLVLAHRAVGLDAQPGRLRRKAPGRSLKAKPGPVTNAELMQAVQQADPPDVGRQFRARVQKEVATAENYAFDVKLGLTVQSLTRHNLLTGSPSVVGSGENQNIGGLHAVDTLAANRRQLLPQLGALREAARGARRVQEHAHARAVRGALGQRAHAARGRGPAAGGPAHSQNACEDVATQLALACNAAGVMSRAHQRHQDLQLREAECSCRLCHCLGVYARAAPHEAEFMPAVAATIHAIAAVSPSLGIGLVFASGANRDLATAGASVPQSVGHAEHGVYPVLRTSLQASLACGHAVAVDLRRQALHAAHPWHGVLAALRGEGCCPTLRLSELAPSTAGAPWIEFLEGTGCAEQLSDSVDMRSTVDVSFEPVPDSVMQKKLDAISAKPMVCFKATNLIAGLQMQGMQKLGVQTSVEQKFTTNDGSCFYQNIISEGDAVALTTGYDGGTTLQVAPTSYVPGVLGSAEHPVTRVFLHAPCCEEETRLLAMLWQARVGMNLTLEQVMDNAALAGVSTPPMRLRGTHMIQNHAGERSTVVFKSACYPCDASWTWDKEHNARCQLALQHGMASVRHISSLIWLAHFYTNPRVPDTNARVPGG